MTLKTPVGQPRVAEDLLHHQRGERRLLSGLEDAAAAGREGGRGLEHRDEERPVPRDDQAGDADRLELGEVVVVLVVTEQAVGYDVARLAVDLADPARVVQQHVVGHLDDLLRSQWRSCRCPWTRAAASSSVRSLMMATARKSTSARCAAGSLRHTPDSKVSRARATAASTAAWSESRPPRSAPRWTG